VSSRDVAWCRAHVAQATKRIWAYIREHNLPKKVFRGKAMYELDDKLSAALGGRRTVGFSSLAQALGKEMKEMSSLVDAKSEGKGVAKGKASSKPKAKGKAKAKGKGDSEDEDEGEDSEEEEEEEAAAAPRQRGKAAASSRGGDGRPKAKKARVEASDGDSDDDGAKVAARKPAKKLGMYKQKLVLAPALAAVLGVKRLSRGDVRATRLLFFSPLSLRSLRSLPPQTPHAQGTM
jgi:chromatin remodeling complex protein RSC6